MSEISSLQTAAVLGASGNIGQLLVDHLAEQGYKVRAIGRSIPKFKSANIQNLAVDYENLDELSKSMDGCKFTFVLIGLEYSTKVWEEQWPPLMRRLVQAAQISKTRFVFLDNVYAYGPVTGPMTEETYMHPTSRKGQVRKQMDALILDAISMGSLNGVTAKAADFYGPGIATSVIGDRFFKQILEKNKVEWFGNPDCKHSFTFAPDIPAALLAIAKSDLQGNIHLPTAKPTLNGHQISQLLEKICGHKLQLSSIRKSALFWLRFFAPILGEFREMFYQYENDYEFDSSKIEEMFKQLKVTPYEAGMSLTLKYFNESKQKAIS